MNTKITYGEILLTTLRKMFLNRDAITLEDITDNRNYATYIDMAPDIMNECIAILNNRVLAQVKDITIDLYNSDFEEYIKENRKYYIFDIATYLRDLDIANYDYLYTEVIQNNLDIQDNLLFEEQNGKLFIDKRFMLKDTTELCIKYRYQPYYYTTGTPYNKIIDLPYVLCPLLPLYLASELYKDDDIAISTQYRNQFETELETISSQLPNTLGTEHVFDTMNYL